MAPSMFGVCPCIRCQEYLLFKGITESQLFVITEPEHLTLILKLLDGVNIEFFHTTQSNKMERTQTQGYYSPFIWCHI
ncbi:17171_t:CDS:2 [Acaulospora morrowiae]|uniref:17171_t:CDS:1 n=1 Tax=Acaulospora morrowiae TaxID=94023 RepID=A0A9N8VJ73_9GLOM|nr:17171_t:CDS:2 [Acaulospora morrowiae]